MTQYLFGTGNLYATTEAGAAPLRFGALQDVSVEFSGDIKQLHGQYQFPLDVARGKSKVEGKIASGNIDVEQFNTLYFGQTTTTGEYKTVTGETGTIPASPFQITVANAAGFHLDLGVYFAATGAPLRQVASAPAAGEYSVTSGGVYTFAAANTGLAVLIDYVYTDAATGRTLEIKNLLMGSTPKFQLICSQLYNGKTFHLCLYSVVIDKLSLPLKMDDYTIGDMGFQAQANSAGKIGFISTTGGE
jgi:hypothetical protein